MAVDNSSVFYRVSDINPRISFGAPAGGPWTASLYADDPGLGVELHFFDGDNNELDNTGFEGVAIGSEHRGIVYWMNQTGKQAPGNIAKIRITHAGGPGAVYIGQCGLDRDKGLDTLTPGSGLYVRSVSQPVFEVIYDGGYKDVGYVAQLDPMFLDAFGTFDDPVATDPAGAWSLISLMKRLVSAQGAYYSQGGRLAPTLAPSAIPLPFTGGGLGFVRSGVVLSSYGSPVYIKAVPKGTPSVTVSASDYDYPIPAASSVPLPLGSAFDIWAQTAGSVSGFERL